MSELDFFTAASKTGSGTHPGFYPVATVDKIVGA